MNTDCPMVLNAKNPEEVQRCTYMSGHNEPCSFEPTEATLGELQHKRVAFNAQKASAEAYRRLGANGDLHDAFMEGARWGWDERNG